MSRTSDKQEEEKAQPQGWMSWLSRFFNPLHDFFGDGDTDNGCPVIGEILYLTSIKDQKSTVCLGILASQNPAFAGRIMGELTQRYDDAVIEALWKTCKAAPEGITENLIPAAIQHMVFMGGRYKRLEEESRESPLYCPKSDVAVAGLMSLHSMAAQKKYAQAVTKQTFEGLCAIGSDYALHTAAALFYRNIPVLFDPLLHLMQQIGEEKGRDPRIHTLEVGNGLLRALTEPQRIVSFLFSIPMEQKEEALTALRLVFTKLGTFSSQLISGSSEKRQSLQEIFQTAVAMTLLGEIIEHLHASVFEPSSENPPSPVMTIFDYRP